MEDISLGAMIIAWVLAALAAGAPPAGFTAAGKFVGSQSRDTAVVRVYRGK